MRIFAKYAITCSHITGIPNYHLIKSRVRWTAAWFSSVCESLFYCICKVKIHWLWSTGFRHPGTYSKSPPKTHWVGLFLNRVFLTLVIC